MNSANNTPHRLTKKEREEHYTRITPEFRATVRRFIRGRTRKEAAEELGITTNALTGLYMTDLRVIYVSNDLLGKIAGSERVAQPLPPGADEHTKFSRVGYRRIGDDERKVIEQFLMGGSHREAADFLEVFGRSYPLQHINHWLTAPYIRVMYVNDFDYAMMSAVVHIRTQKGYYEITSDALDPRKKPLHVKITPSRRARLEQYVQRFGRSRNHPKYEKPAESIGINPRVLGRTALRHIQYIPAQAYLRVLENTGASGLESDDEPLRPYIGRSSELERKLEDYSLEALKQRIAIPLKGVCGYLKEPETSAFIFLQRLTEPGTDPARLIDELSKYLQILEHNATIFTQRNIEMQPVTHSDFLNYFSIPNRQTNRKR